LIPLFDESNWLENWFWLVRMFLDKIDFDIRIDSNLTTILSFWPMY
jgi:hypothetical protein